VISLAIPGWFKGASVALVVAIAAAGASFSVQRSQRQRASTVSVGPGPATTLAPTGAGGQPPLDTPIEEGRGSPSQIPTERVVPVFDGKTPSGDNAIPLQQTPPMKAPLAVPAVPVAPATPGPILTRGAGPAVALDQMETVDRIELAEPPLPAVAPEADDRRVRLRQISASTNQVTDIEEWFETNRLDLPSSLPADADPRIPRTYRGLDLVAAMVSSGRGFAGYGRDFETLVIVGVDLVENVATTAFDFNRYRLPPGTASGPSARSDQSLKWATVVDDTLLVSHAHSGYAADSKGLNGYLTAIKVETGEVLWRTGPLVANAKTFLVVGDVIVSGYGFTDEDDYLYVTDRRTGELLARQLVASAPEFVMRRGGESTFLVRTYNTDYRFRLDFEQ